MPLFEAALGVSGLGIRDNFFELGGNSLLALRLIARVRQAFGADVPVVQFLQRPTIEALARLVDGDGEPAAAAGPRLGRARSASGARLDDVAIIGMGGRFPGAPTVAELWKNLCDGVESITFFEPGDLDPSIDPGLAADPAYVRARGVLKDVEMFDAAFFGISPKEAEIMDPQHRLFLEVAWEVLEEAGYVREDPAVRVGVFGGMYNATYFQKHVAGRPDLIERVGDVPGHGGEREGLRRHPRRPQAQPDRARGERAHGVLDVAGGGGAGVPQPSQPRVRPGPGRRRPPSPALPAAATSTRRGRCSLPTGTRERSTRKRRARSSATASRCCCSSGSPTPWPTATRSTVSSRAPPSTTTGATRRASPRPASKARPRSSAPRTRSAGVDPRTITYVETHGTATPLGDPIEVEALTQAFRAGTADRGFCALGSIKSNIGHTVIAAGGAGLIKTALALTHRKLPPSLHYRAPNPKIDFASSPSMSTRPWPTGRPGRARGARVSARFGVGGTNAHVVVEEPPLPQPSGPSRPKKLLLLSARTEAALEATTARLRDHIAAHPGIDLADVACTLMVGRREFSHRRAFVASDAAEALAVLGGGTPSRVLTRKVESAAPEIAFLFPGQGAQYAGMGATLYRDEPAFRAVVDYCAEALLPVLGRDLRELLFPQPGDTPAAAEALRRTEITQPALFVTEFALAQLWGSWGVRPAAMIGHSVGEFVAAVIAGVMSLEDGLRLVALRGRLMRRAARGGHALGPTRRRGGRSSAERLGPGHRLGQRTRPVRGGRAFRGGRGASKPRSPPKAWSAGRS